MSDLQPITTVLLIITLGLMLNARISLLEKRVVELEELLTDPLTARRSQPEGSPPGTP